VFLHEPTLELPHPTDIGGIYRRSRRTVLEVIQETSDGIIGHSSNGRRGPGVPKESEVRYRPDSTTRDATPKNRTFVAPQMLTCSRATLVYVKSNQNVTLSLPEALLRRFRVYAAVRNRSMTQLMTDAIRALLEQEERDSKAKRRFLDRIRNAPDRGTKGKVRWSRDELHER